MSHHSDSSPHHIAPLKEYLGIFGALLVLTAATVGVSVIELPHPFSIIAAMGIALVKAGLVVGFFMHLKHDEAFNVLVFFSSLLFLFLFFLFVFLDIDTRNTLIPEEGNLIAPASIQPAIPPEGMEPPAGSGHH